MEEAGCSTRPPSPGYSSGTTTESLAPSVGAARLTVIAHGRVCHTQVVSTDTVIGRDSEADIVVEDQQVSRLHARFKRIPIGFSVEDMASRNGTTVNGVPVRRRKLEFGDRIQIGATILLFTRHDAAEDQVFELQKMEAMGRLVAGVAHDFNNLLGAIVGNLAFLRRLPRDGELGDAPVREALSDANDAAHRAVDIVSQLLGFARVGSSDFRALNAESLMSEVARLFRRTLDRSIAIVTDCPPDLLIKGDATQLHQVLMNLCLNARDAMSQGGVLTIKAQPAVLSQSEARLFAGSQDMVQLSVEDTGMGMDSITRQRIFEPFFSSKATGKGTGLGLATVYGIVKNHGGIITVDSEPGQGSLFRVYIPSGQAGQEQPEVTRVRQEIPAESDRRILIVDDDGLVRRSNYRLLGQLGYSVRDAGSGQEALDLLKQERFDLVVLDLIMPDMSGEETFHELRKMIPEQRVLFVSGYYDDEKVRVLLQEGGAHFLRKPYSSDVLHEHLLAAFGSTVGN